jgi:hypothetical protein
MILDSLISTCPMMEINGQAYVRADLFRGYVSNFKKAIEHRDSSLLFQRRGLRVSRVVDIEEFAESREYLGLKASLRPAIKEHLINLFHSGQYYIEAVFTGATGIGKGFAAKIGVSYCLYLAACLHNPQAEYGLAPGSSIYFVIQSVTARLARKAVFNELLEGIRDSPWFAKNFPYDKSVTTEMRFPNNIYITPFPGDDTSVIGLNVMVIHIDELNFMARTEDSAHTRHTGEDEYDQARKIYLAISRRMRGRFQSLGRVPGKIFLLSASNYPGDFTDQKIREAETDPTIYVMKMAQWESIPSSRFCGEKFRMLVGNETTRSRVLEEGDEVPDDCRVLEVPIEYKKEFIKDPEGTLRDVAGETTESRYPFIPYKEELAALQQEFKIIHQGHSLFLKDEITFEDYFLPGEEDPDFSVIIDSAYFDTLDSTAVDFAGHLDVGLSSDAAGLSIGHVVGFTTLPAKTYFEETDLRAPIFQIDGSLRILARPSEEIQFDWLCRLVLYISSLLNLKIMSCDSYQSVMLLQAWQRAKIRCGTQSVDTNLEPWVQLKNAIRTKRLRYGNALLARELRALEKDGERVDHPKGGTKDLADSVAGTVYNIYRLSRGSGVQRSRDVARQRNRSRPSDGRRRRVARRLRV